MSELNKAYTILGLEPGSSKDEIQKRYKRLAVAWHPDRFPTADGKADAEAELKKILNARDLLIKHFDSGKHTPGTCECIKGAAAAAQAAPAQDTRPINPATAGKNPKMQSAAEAARAAQKQAPEPTEEQRRHWDKLERQLEREEQEKEESQQKELLNRFFEQQKGEVAKPKLKRIKPKRKPTIQDELNRDPKQPYGWPEKLAEFFIVQFDEWKVIVLSPLEYFESMELEGGFRQPVIFVCLIAAINGLAWLLTNLANPLGALTGFLALIAFSFVLAGVTFGLSKSLGGSGEFEGTYRMCTAAIAPYVVLWVPLVNVFAVIYSVMLLKLGLERAQELTPTRCTTVVGLQVLVVIIVGAVAVVSGLSQLVGGKPH